MPFIEGKRLDLDPFLPTALALTFTMYGRTLSAIFPEEFTFWSSFGEFQETDSYTWQVAWAVPWKVDNAFSLSSKKLIHTHGQVAWTVPWKVVNAFSLSSKKLIHVHGR